MCGLSRPLVGVGWKYMDLLEGSYRPDDIKDIRAGWLNNFAQAFATRGIVGAVGLGLLLVFGFFINGGVIDKEMKSMHRALVFLFVLPICSSNDF